MDMTPLAASAFARLFESATGQQLAAGRRWRIETALGPVLRAQGVETLDGLAMRLGRDARSPLAREVVEALLNHETSFYRDPAAFRLLVTDGLAAVAARRPERRLRLWSAGCATGQEAYSLALAAGRAGSPVAGWDVSILGTDFSHAAVEQAERGIYSHFEIQRGLPIGEMMANFEPEGEAWRARAELRARVTFRQHNLLDPPPPGRFDVILCRNVLLYFAPERRRAVLDGLAGAIAPDGLLMLGAGETVLGQTDAFVADPVLKGLYRPAPRR